MYVCKIKYDILYDIPPTVYHVGTNSRDLLSITDKLMMNQIKRVVANWLAKTLQESSFFTNIQRTKNI